MARANAQINVKPDVTMMARANALLLAQMVAMRTAHASKQKTAKMV